MSGAPTPDVFSARQLQAIGRLVSQRAAESVRIGRAVYPHNLRLAKTVAVDGVYPEDPSDTFAIRFVDIGFHPRIAGTSTISESERTAEGDTDNAADQIGREINGKYIPEGSYVAALWQPGVAGNPETYGEWWLRWPTGPNPDPQPNCDCYLVSTTGCSGGAPSYWDLSVAGLADSTCTSCNLWNGDFRLCYQSDGVWESDPYDGTECGHVAGDPLWRLAYNFGTGYYDLTAVGLGYQWRKTIATWSCLAANNLTLRSPTPVPAPCTSVPATLTVDPCLAACSLCIGGLAPNPLAVTFAGLVDHQCDGCETINATHLLDAQVACGWYKLGSFPCTVHQSQVFPPTYEIRAWLRPASAWPYNTQLWVLLSTSIQIDWSDRITQYFYLYDHGTPALLDCSQTYHLSLHHMYGDNPRYNACSTTPPPTCRVN